MSKFFNFKNKGKLSYGFRKTSLGIASFLLGISLILSPIRLEAAVNKITGGTEKSIITETNYTNKLPDFKYKTSIVKMISEPSNLSANDMTNVTIKEVKSEIEGLIKYEIGLNVANDFSKSTGSYTSNPYLGFFISKGFEFEKVVLEYDSTYYGFTYPWLELDESKKNKQPTVIRRNVVFTKDNIKSKVEEIRNNIDSKAFEKLVIGEENGKYVVTTSSNEYEKYHLRMFPFQPDTKNGIIYREPSMILKDFDYVDLNVNQYARENGSGPGLKDLLKSSDDNFHNLKTKDTVSSLFTMKEANNNWASGVRGDVPIKAYVYVKPTRKDGIEFDKSRYVAGFLKSWDNNVVYRRVALSSQDITISDAKTQAIEYINSLKYLTSVQKTRIISNVNVIKDNANIYGTFKDGKSIQDIMYRAQLQDTQMKQLKELYDSYKPIINKAKYKYSDENLKTNFDTALLNAENVLSGKVDKWEGYSEDPNSIGKVAEILEDAYNKLNGREDKIMISPTLKDLNTKDGSFIISNIDLLANEIKVYSSSDKIENKNTYNDVVSLTSANNILTITKNEKGTWISNYNWFTLTELSNGDIKVIPNEKIRTNLEGKYIIAGVRNSNYIENGKQADEGKATNVIKYDTHLSVPEIKHGDNQEKIVISTIDTDVKTVSIVTKNENGAIIELANFNKENNSFKNSNYTLDYQNGTLTIIPLNDEVKKNLIGKNIYAKVIDTSDNSQISTSKIIYDILDKPVVESGYINENKVTIKLPINNGLGTAKIGDTVIVTLDNDENTKYTVVLTAENIYKGNVEIGLKNPLTKGKKILAELMRNETKVKSDEYIVNSVNSDKITKDLTLALNEIIKKARANVDSKTNEEIAVLLKSIETNLNELKISSPSQDFSKYTNLLETLKKLNSTIDLTTTTEKNSKKEEIKSEIEKNTLAKDALEKISKAIIDTIEVDSVINASIKEIKDNLNSEIFPTIELNKLKEKENEVLTNYSENNELNYNTLTAKSGDTYTNSSYSVKEKDKTILLYKYAISEILAAIDEIKEYNKTNDLNNRAKAIEKINLVDAGKEYKDKLMELLKDIDTKIAKKNEKSDAKKLIDEMKYLNESQKEALKTEIDKAVENGINSIIEKAKELDNKMKELRDLLELEKPIKNDSIYTSATTESKTAYDNAIKSGEDITDTIKKDEDNKNKDEVQKIIDDIKLAHSNLNSEFNKKVEDYIKNELPKMTNLNKAQKEDATNKLKASTPTNFETLKTEISKLNDKMGDLKTKLNEETARNKDNEYKYYNATDVLAKEYDDAMKAGNDVADPNSMINANLADVEKLISDINYDKLDGKPTDFTKLENEASDDRVNRIKESPQYYNDTDEKQQAYDDKVEKGKELVAKKEKVVNKTLKVTQKEVDKAYNDILAAMPNGKPTSIKELNDLVNNYENIKSLPKYYNEVDSKQQAYDNAIAEGKKVIDKKINDEKVLQKDVDAEVSKIKEALNNLNGLETNKTGLKQTIDEAENAKNTGLYINEKDKEKKEALDKALEEAKKVYNDPKATIEDVVNADNKLKAEIDALTGKETDLSKLQKLIDESPEIKKSTIYTAENLENKKAYDEAIEKGKKVLEIKPIPTQEEVDAVVKLIEEAKSKLNGSSNKLKELIDEAEKEKLDNNYINSDKDKKDELDKALEKAKEILNNENSLQVSIDKAIEDLEKALKALNGDLKKYKDYAEKFIYEDTSISERFDDDFYANINLGNSITNIVEKMLIDKSVDVHNFLGGIQIGVGKQVSEVLNTRVGGFIEYKNGGVQNIALGANVKTDYLTSFIRYRIAILPEIKGAINHNVDLFVKGHYKTYMTELSTVEAGLTGYITYSSKTKLDNVYIKDRVGAKVEVTTKLAYEKDGLIIYIMPGMNYAYNTQVLVDKNQNELVIPRNNELNYRLVSGVSKKFDNGINVGGDIVFDGSLTQLYDKTKNGTHRFRVDSFIGYNW